MTVSLSRARALPAWRSPIALLVLMAFAMPLAFQTWTALLNNFVVEAAAFEGADIGWLHTFREIPGFLAVGVILVILILREQTLAVASLALLGVGTALTGFLPSFWGLMFTTLLGSVGFHYYETVNQSLQLQWLDKERAPQIMGWILAAGSAASFLAYGALMLGWEAFGWSYQSVYIAGGGATVVLAIVAWALYPQFEAPNPQIKRMVLRRRYWLYYALQFMSGARRQIFVVFAGFMMVQKYGFEVQEVTALFLINYVANMVFAPLMGGLIARVGERAALIFEYVGLIGVFTSYAALYYFDWPWEVAATLYVVDHLFFALAIAMKTYFQKIAAPGDIAPTAAVAFTINHIAAVFLPFMLGYLWEASPAAVFWVATGLAFGSLVLSTLIPRHPAPGQETVLPGPVPRPAE